MPEVLIPPDIEPESETIELVDDGTRAFSPSQGKGVTQRQQDYEPRLRVRQVFRALRDADRARMIAALRKSGGKYATVRAQVGRVRRGSISASELLTNNTFASGTTGLSVVTSTASLSVADRVLRVTHTRAQSYAMATLSSPVSVTQYAPYSLRAMLQIGRNTGSNIYELFAGDTATNASLVNAASAISNTAELRSTSFVDRFGSIYAGFDYNGAGAIAGDYFDVPWWSLSRCFLIDNGPNLLTRSDEIDHPDWTTSATATVDDNETTAPDGTATADAIEETAATQAHYVIQAKTVSSSAADYSLACAIKSNGRQWAYLRMSENSGGTQVYHTFDLTNGVVGSTSSAGANWSNIRPFIKSLGNGWYYCCIVARKTNAATSVSSWIGPSSGDNVNSYAGTPGTGVRAWRATLAQSSVPTRLVQSTSAAVSATAQTGNALRVKGLPASTSGLLTSDDVVEVNGELLQLTASLDSDAAGLGYLQFAPSVFRSPSDNDPVIVNAPMPKFILANNPLWNNEWGKQSDFELILEQVYE